MAETNPLARMVVQSFPVFDECLGKIVWWQCWSESRCGKTVLQVMDAAGRRINGVQEVRITPEGTLLVLGTKP
jgi:hypothetical protein